MANLVKTGGKIVIGKNGDIIKKEVENKKQKGITLVALVITIILLLILAGVTIRGVLGEKGLVEEAKNATQRYGQAQDEEQNVVKNFLDELRNINSGGDGTGGNPGNPSKPGENTTNPGGNTVDPDNPTGPEVPPETPGESLAASAQPGDYVRYTVPEKTFTMTTEQTGYTSAQTYNTGDYTGLWQVLYNDTEHGLQIISANDVTNGKNLYLNGKEGYNNSVGTLNSFCSNYVNATYATSGRCVGSNPVRPEGTKELYSGSYNYIGLYANDLIKDDTEYLSDFNALKGATHQNTDGIWNINKEYWLASRYVSSTTSRTDVYVRFMYAAGTANHNPLWFVRSSGSTTPYSSNSAVRVVITLKSGIKTSDGTGGSGSPYELVQ